MNPTFTEVLASSLFGLAVLHTFVCGRFQKLASRFPEGSVAENTFHLLGEVEVVFGLWAAILLSLLAMTVDPASAIAYAESLNFTEPIFVFTIMTIAATKPVIEFARWMIFSLARLIPIARESAIFATCLIVGPLLGSFITEPAAMTVTALILKQRFYDRGVSRQFMYGTLAVLFVNISIGGVLTPFAAPPVLMVAGKWGWDIPHMLRFFGWKAALAVLVNASCLTFFLRRELKSLTTSRESLKLGSPIGLIAIHLAVLALVVATAHHPIIFVGIFLLFLGLATATKEYQSELLFRQSLLVAFFLGGLVVLGGLQSWWLMPLLHGQTDLTLFLGATGLTAFTDNAALTFLGSQIEGISEGFKYALVSGAVAGGGLTVIANAPNPAGFSILQESFGESGISPFRLAAFAMAPTLVAMASLWFL